MPRWMLPARPQEKKWPRPGLCSTPRLPRPGRALKRGLGNWLAKWRERCFPRPLGAPVETVDDSAAFFEPDFVACDLCGDSRRNLRCAGASPGPGAGLKA